MAKNKLLTVRMTTDELDVLSVCAQAKGVSVAGYLRMLLGLGTAITDGARTMITDSAPSFEPSANVLNDLERLRNKMFAKYRPGYVADAADPGHTCFATQWIGELAKVWTKMMADPMVLMLKNPGDKQSPSGPQSSSGQIRNTNATPGSPQSYDKPMSEQLPGSRSMDSAPSTLEGLLNRQTRTKETLPGILKKGKAVDAAPRNSLEDLLPRKESKR